MSNNTKFNLTYMQHPLAEQAKEQFLHLMSYYHPYMDLIPRHGKQCEPFQHYAGCLMGQKTLTLIFHIYTQAMTVDVLLNVCFHSHIRE